jgi:hypothetical protein
MVQSLKQSLIQIRLKVFGAAMLVSGLCTVGLCLMPILFANSVCQSVFANEQQEKFFFDLFGLIGGAWLIVFICAINNWGAMAKVGQWLGIILLCLNQVTVIELFKILFDYHVSFLNGLWLVPFVLELYLLGSYFGFFTMPALAQKGNKTLTGLGTLVLLLPLLLAKDQIVQGSHYLFGLFY